MKWITRAVAVAAVTAGGAVAGRAVAGRLSNAGWSPLRQAAWLSDAGWSPLRQAAWLSNAGWSPLRQAAWRYGRIPGSLRHAKLPEWLVTTVNAAPTGIVGPDGRLPEPLARLGESVEVQVRPAPGDKGTELWVRPRGTKSDPDGWRELRVTLRETKQVLETGEVLQPDRPSTTRDTVLGKPLAYATRHAREEGRL